MKLNRAFLGRLSPSLLTRVGLVVGFLVLMFGFFFVTESVRKKVLTYNRRIMNTYARLWALAVSDAVGGEELNILFEEIIRKSDFPIILTDPKGQPIAWRNLNIGSDDTEKAAEILKQIKKNHNPIPIRVQESRRNLGYIYFGESAFIRVLRYIPIVEIVILLIFFYFGFVEYRRIKSRELQNIWLGMAKESAHQLGTPASSLMGWLELLRTGSTNLPQEKIVEEMEEDIQVLNKIVQRFGKIGSAPKLVFSDINMVVEESLGYLKGRLPDLGGDIKLHTMYNKIPKVPANSLLLGWAIENLVKNAIEAMDKGKGRVDVATIWDESENLAKIVITDNGRGIPGGDQKRIFSPGFTTKRRGWGLGLSLARRIVEEYHHGKLQLIESVPYEKTTFVIKLPGSL